MTLFVGCDSLPPDKATVHISLTTEGGGNFYGAEVELISVPSGNRVYTAIGRSKIIRFTGVVYGTYDFTVRHPDFITGGLVSIDVSQDRVDETLDLKRLRANLVDVMIRTSDGMSITNAKVTLRNNDRLLEEPLVYEVLTSGSLDSAIARFTDVAYGTYTLTAEMGDRYFFIPFPSFEVRSLFVLPVDENDFHVLLSRNPAEIARVTIPFRTSDNMQIVGAVVKLASTLTDYYVTQTVSSAYGATQAEAFFGSVLFGRYTLTITLHGYHQHTSSVHVNSNEINVPLITLFHDISNFENNISPNN